MSKNVKALRRLIADCDIAVILQTPANAEFEVSCDRFRRSLTERGKTDAFQVEVLINHHTPTDLKICSPETFVRETIDVCPSMLHPLIVIRELLPCTKTESSRQEIWREDLALELHRFLSQRPDQKNLRICAVTETLVPLATILLDRQLSPKLHDEILLGEASAVVIEKGQALRHFTCEGGIGWHFRDRTL